MSEHALRILAASAAYEIVRRERISLEEYMERCARIDRLRHQEQLRALRDREADMLAIITETDL